MERIYKYSFSQFSSSFKIIALNVSGEDFISSTLSLGILLHSLKCLGKSLKKLRGFLYKVNKEIKRLLEVKTTLFLT